MNKVILIGRLTNDPEVRYTQDQKAVANYTLAVDRRAARNADGHTESDFIRCTCWEKKAEFAEKYLRKGMKIAITGRIQTGSYKDKDGKTVYTTDIVVEDQEFCEAKGSAPQKEPQRDPEPKQARMDDFMDIPDDLDGLPFN